MIDDAEIMTDETEIAIQEEHKECCGEYLPGVERVSRFRYISLKEKGVLSFQLLCQVVDSRTAEVIKG